MIYVHWSNLIKCSMEKLCWKNSVIFEGKYLQWRPLLVKLLSTMLARGWKEKCKKLKCITTWKINWKVIFSEINWLFSNFERFNDLIFIILLYELCSKSTREILEETLARSNSDALKTTLRRLSYFKITLPLL